MPELPEVETMRRGLLPTVGSRVVSVAVPPSRYRPIAMTPPLPELQSRLVGRRIEAVRRLGKRVLLDFDSADVLVLQPKMAGLVSLEDVPSEAHLRLVIGLSGGSAPQLQYWDRRGLGTVHLWTAAELAEQLGERRLGPDALEISFEEFMARFAPLRREVKPALLEQHRVAGVGNLYASEILHRARVSPHRRCDELSRRAWRKIYDQMRSVLAEAIEHEGSTLSDGTYRNALNQSGGYQNRHLVYDRAGKGCLTCGKAAIERSVQAQRSTFFCPRCQRG